VRSGLRDNTATASRRCFPSTRRGGKARSRQTSPRGPAMASERPAREQAAPKHSRLKKARPTVRPFEIESAPTVSAVSRSASCANGFASGHGRPPAKCSKGLGITGGEGGIRSTHKELSLAGGWLTELPPSRPLAEAGDPRSAQQSPNEVGVARAPVASPAAATWPKSPTNMQETALS
jgi:hypothetical protein